MLLDHDGEAKPGAGTDRMVGDHTVDAQTLRQQQLADVDIDADVDSTHFAIEIDLGIGRGLGTARQSIGHRHDLAEPHVGIIAIGRHPVRGHPVGRELESVPCQATRGLIIGETVVLPQPSRRRSVAGGAVIVTLRRTKPGSRFITGSAGWWNGYRFSRVFTCFARVSTFGRFRPSGRRGGVRGSRRRKASTSKTTRALT